MNVHVELERLILRVVEERLAYDDIAAWFAARIARRR